MGSGVYSQKLSYKDWFNFNIAQRVHLNFVESISTYLVLLLVSGLSYPIIAAILGMCLIIGRIIYSIGYMISPILRVPGGFISGVSFFGLVGLAGYTAWSIACKRAWF